MVDNKNFQNTLDSDVTESNKMVSTRCTSSIKLGELKMCGLQKIGEIALKYCISSRTLRYYEEIGILDSQRIVDSKYRFYDDSSIERLEQILLLRKLQLPIKDIQRIFLSEETSVAVESLLRKLKQVENDIAELAGLKSIIQKFLVIIKGYENNSNDALRLLQEKYDKLLQVGTTLDSQEFYEEGIKLNTEIISNDYGMDVRLIQLKSMRVAYYCAESASPEMDAWSVMLKWVEEKELDKLTTTRFFGFNNPCPTEGSPVYGYEVWVTIPENIEVSGEIRIKQFDGGDYAVICSHLHNITERWHRLYKWVEDSGYTMAEHQWLEETISPIKASSEKMQLDLYCPIMSK
jgi:DNA-binding transcriptional MerR regulator/DNA gyrase inhibitor GyrI